MGCRSHEQRKIVDYTHAGSSVEHSQRAGLLAWAAGVGAACLGLAVFHLVTGTYATAGILVVVAIVNALVWSLRRRISTQLLTDIEVVGLSIVIYAVALHAGATGARGGITSTSIVMLVPLFMVIAALSARCAYQWIVVAIGGALASIIWLEILDLPAISQSRNIFRLVAYPAWLVMLGLSHLIYSSVRKASRLTAALHAREQQYRGIFDGAVDAYIVHRFDGTIVDVNAAACEAYGYSREELIGGQITMLIAGTDSRFDSLSKLERGELDTVTVERTHRRYDGTTFPVEIRVQVFEMSGESLCVAVIRDISDRRSRDRRIAFQAQVLDTVASELIVVDQSGKTVYANRSAAEFVGCSVCDLMGSDPSDRFVRPEEKYRGDEILQSALAGTVWCGEVTLRDARGRDVPSLVTATPLFSDQGRVNHAIILAVDISDHKTLERQLRDATLTAERSARAKSSFLASMSHEIRTPLNGIIGFADVLLQQNPRADQREALDHLKASGQTLLSILNDVLDISKLESGRYDLHPVDFDVPALLSNVEALYGHGARDKGLSLTVDVDSSVPRFLKGDPDRLRQLLGNLVSNAIKYTDEGRVCVRACAESEDSGTVVLTIEVEDTGIGIEEEDLPRLFNLFEQLHQNDRPRPPGTGLGLAICQRLVESMDGSIRVRSRPGVGSTFTCSVRVEPSARTAADPVDSVARSMDHLSREGLRILVVDDDRVSSLVANRLLETAGHSVDVAENGAIAVDATCAKPYDLVLMDLQMPVLGGLEATAAIRSKSPYDPVIIGMSASAMDDDRVAMLDAGMNAVIAKPVTREVLLQAIDGISLEGQRT